jgi:tRNA dimethylallyltransferase
MDTMALYRGLDILAAKPSPEERRRVPHHLLDVLDPWQSASVSWWLEQARRCCEEIRGRGRRVLIVGGTPLYLKALLFGLFEGPGADVKLRKRLEEESVRVGSAVLHARLSQVDPATAQRLHPNDARRIIRALEVWEMTGKPLSQWQTQWSSNPKSEIRNPKSETPTSPVSDFGFRISDFHRCIWLDRPREELYARIDARVRDMAAQGLVEEVAALRQLPQPVSRQAAQAAGYLEVCAFLDGDMGQEEMIARIQQRSRQLAKRQLTWFRSLSECRPADEQLTEQLWGSTIQHGYEKAEVAG